MSDDEASEVLWAGHVVSTPAWQKLSEGQAVHVMSSNEVWPSGQTMAAMASCEDERNKNSRTPNKRVEAFIIIMQLCVGACVIYGNWTRQYLTVDVFLAGGAHAGGLVVGRINHEGIFESVEANTTGLARRTRRRRAVTRALILDPGPAPRAGFTQFTARVVVDSVEPTVAVAVRDACALGWGDCIEVTRFEGEPPRAEHVGGASGAVDGAVAMEAWVARAVQDGVGRNGGVGVGGTQAQLPTGAKGIDRAGGAAGAIGCVALVTREACALRHRDAALRGDGIGRTRCRDIHGRLRAGEPFHRGVDTDHGCLCGVGLTGSNDYGE